MSAEVAYSLKFIGGPSWARSSGAKSGCTAVMLTPMPPSKALWACPDTGATSLALTIRLEAEASLTLTLVLTLVLALVLALVPALVLALVPALVPALVLALVPALRLEVVEGLTPALVLVLALRLTIRPALVMLLACMDLLGKSQHAKINHDMAGKHINSG